MATKAQDKLPPVRKPPLPAAFTGAAAGPGATASALRGPGDPATPWQVGWEWLTGTGPRNHVFGPGDPFTELLRQHQHIEDTRQQILRRLQAGDPAPGGRKDYSLAGVQGVPKYLQDYSNVLTAGHTGNLAVTYLGSYNLEYHARVLENGTAEVEFRVWNTSTIASATHPPVIGYTEWWERNISDSLNKRFSSGPMSETTQEFRWTETITFK